MLLTVKGLRAWIYCAELSSGAVKGVTDVKNLRIYEKSVRDKAFCEKQNSNNKREK